MESNSSDARTKSYDFMMKLIFTEDTEALKKRRDCLDWLRKHRLDADLTETVYGLQLLGLIRLYGRSVYVP